MIRQSVTFELQHARTRCEGFANTYPSHDAGAQLIDKLLRLVLSNIDAARWCLICNAFHALHGNRSQVPSGINCQTRTCQKRAVLFIRRL
jgi:hypothetical protein